MITDVFAVVCPIGDRLKPIDWPMDRGSEPRNDGVVWKKFLEHTDPVSPACFHFQAHQTIAHPHQSVDINGFVEFVLLSLHPIVFVL